MENKENKKRNGRKFSFSLFCLLALCGFNAVNMLNEHIVKGIALLAGIYVSGNVASKLSWILQILKGKK